MCLGKCEVQRCRVTFVSLGLGSGKVMGAELEPGKRWVEPGRCGQGEEHRKREVQTGLTKTYC